MGGASVEKKQRDRLALLLLKGPPQKCSAHGRIRQAGIQGVKRGHVSSEVQPLPGEQNRLLSLMPSA